MVVLAPARDTILAGPPLDLFDAATITPPLPLPVVPGPGNPAIPLPAPVARDLGRLYSLHVAAPISHAPLTTFFGAKVAGWTDPIGLDVGTIDVTVPRTDPAWAFLAIEAKPVRGRYVYKQDPTGLEVFLGVDGVCVQTGVIVDYAPQGDEVALRIETPPSVLEGRTLGAGGTYDLLDGRGSFPTASLAGWAISATLTHRWTADSFDGPRALEVSGTGHVYAPPVTVPGIASIHRQVFTQVLVDGASPTRVAAISTEVRNLAGTIVEADWSEQQAQAVDPEQPQYHQIGSNGRLPRDANTYRVWAKIAVVTKPGEWLRLDRLTYSQRGATGSQTRVDLTEHVRSIMASAQSDASGGRLGLVVKVQEPCGSSDSMVLLHEDDPGVLENLNALADRSDGPEIWCDTAWRVVTGKRQGQDRTDIVLSDDTVLAWSPSVDGKARFDSLRISTGYGSGPSRVALGFDQPFDGTRRTRRTTVRGPNELSFRATERWGAGHAEYLSRVQRVCEVVVSMDLGLRIATGDGLWCVLSSETDFIGEPLRVADRRFDVDAETCTLSMGADPKVRL